MKSNLTPERSWVATGSATMLAMCLVLSSTASAQSTRTKDSESAEIAGLVLAGYEVGGMNEVTRVSQECYEMVATKLFCINLDLAAQHLDRLAASAGGFPPNSYFLQTAVSERARPVLAQTGLKGEQANTYLDLAARTMAAAMNDQMAASMRRQSKKPQK